MFLDKELKKDIRSFILYCTMTITLSEKIEDSTQADGSRHIAFCFAFHNGLEIIKRMLRPYGWDDETALSDMIPIVEQEVIDNEDNGLIGQVESNLIDPVTAEPVHPETDAATVRIRRFHRKLIRYAMRHRDIKAVRWMLYPIWYELKFNLSYNMSQIASYLDITIAQANKINDRMQAFHDSLSMIDGDDGYLEDID